MIVAIARHELRRLFYSPLAWTVLAVVLFVLALLLMLFVENFLTVIQPRFAGQQGALGVTDTVVAPTLLWAGVIMLAVAPLLTMRSLSEERQQGSLVLLTSAPISSTEIVLGKYLGLILFVLLMVGLIAALPASLALGTPLDWGKLAAGVLGLFLLLASFVAAGLYLSSLTTTPLLAAISSFGVLLLLLVLYVSGSSPATGSELFIYLSHFGHFVSFLEGLFDSSDFIYYLLFTATFLVLTIRRLANQRLQY